ncbi:BnaCnng34600D [Brassica napus]|uniref:BnaCnng34600D protein n=1 Tax=Brassica napus TaxID=3708 RepID=A0A078J7C9_BRANA|nr:BnaCnng34600D [Brassica napus]
MLPTFLESFPNLKSIVLDLTHSKTDMLPIALSSVPPQCLLSSLEFVEIKSRYEAEFVLMELANYFNLQKTL